MFTLQLELVPNIKSEKELTISEKEWRPIRSLIGIANRKYEEKNDCSIIGYDELRDLDENIGHGLDDSACICLAKEMEDILNDPFALVDYGMTIDIKNGKSFLTYPTKLCTSYFEDVETEKFYESLEDESIIGRRVQSFFRTSEPTLQNVISFFKKCGGFIMP
jgi:hypothetical protein